MARNSMRGILADFRNPSNFLPFQYNPTGISESKQANWAEATIPGADDALATFGNGSSLQINFQLFLNAYGEGGDLPRGDRLYVEKTLEFLYKYTEVDPEGNAGASPPILFLALGKVRFPSVTRGVVQSNPALPVRLVQLNVERTIFDPTDYVTLRATADLTLVRHVGFPQ